MHLIIYLVVDVFVVQVTDLSFLKVCPHINVSVGIFLADFRCCGMLRLEKYLYLVPLLELSYLVG